ncbi:hypothetical protein B0H11DRAFT_1745321, partial [Mycena galericulata]
LLKQFHPRMAAYMRAQLDLLDERCAIGPAFPGSAFSTAEFSFGDAPMNTRKDIRDVFYGFRAITILGTFDADQSSVLVIPKRDLAIRCPPGTTVLIASSVDDYFFTKLATGEKRYLFQQFFHAGLQRWIDRGYRSDATYDAEATPEEKEVVEEKLAGRVSFAMKLLGRLHEVYV